MTAKKVKSARYELMAMKVGDFGGKTEVLAEVSLDELKAIGRIAAALAGDKSGVLLEAVKKHVDFWESAKAEKPAKRWTKEQFARAEALQAEAEAILQAKRFAVKPTKRGGRQ